MRDIKKELEVEKKELDNKIQKLTNFILTDTFKRLIDIEQLTMTAQLTAMLTYSTILEIRRKLVDKQERQQSKQREQG